MGRRGVASPSEMPVWRTCKARGSVGTRRAAALLTGWTLLFPSVCAADHWTNADLTIFEVLGDPEALGVGAATALRGTGARAATGNPAGLLETVRNEAVVDLSGMAEEPWL